MPDMPNMATPIQPSSPKSGKTAKMVGIIVVVLIVIGLIAYFVLAYVKKPAPNTGANQPAGNEQQNQATDNNQTGGEQPQRPKAPDELFSYVGEVKSIGNGQITLTVKPELNYVDQETVVTARVDATTQVIRRSIPKTLPADGNIQNLFKQESIALSDVKVGDQVTVVSDTNIKDKTDFTASRIEVLNVD